ncbi:MAG TPA: NAD(P)/FAD-dependent oxidoreductase [Streptosporangiaceae bacterium]|nr:NAD(P)/FAD-dependent oxidoreductase [Streptosporangiaceae bacterium]
MRVVVVGAGFAGLMAADLLARSGQEVVVLEARDRVGGRVWSAELVPGDPRTMIERGAEFVLDGYDVMRSVLADLGLALADTAMSYYDREPRFGTPAAAGSGGPVTSREVAAIAAAIAATALTAPPGSSLADVAASLPLPGWPGARAALDAYLSRAEVTNGISAALLSARVAGDLTSGAGPRPSWRVAGGNQRLALGLAARLGTAVRLRTPVREIRHDRRRVGVRTDRGELTADAVIVTVPMAVLRELPFSPALPGRYLDAWERAGIAHNAKLHLPLLAPAAASAVQSVPGRFWTWTAIDGTGLVQPVLHAFGGTAEGLAALGAGGGRADGPAAWAARIADLRPELAVDTTRALLTTWNDDPWAGESYTALTTGTADGDDELIALAHGRVHFAGEHTAGDWAGLMEGALRSGARAAAEVLAPAR